MKTTIDQKLLRQIIVKAEEKSDQFHFLRGVFPHLLLEEILELLDFSFSHRKYLIDLFMIYFESHWDGRLAGTYQDVLDKVQHEKDKRTDYRQKLRAAALSNVIIKLIGDTEERTKTYVVEMLKSPYKRIRKLGYDVLSKCYSRAYSDSLSDNWHKYKDEEIIDIVTTHRHDFSDTELVKEMAEYITAAADDDGYLPLAELINRNLLLSILAVKDQSLLGDLQRTDPLSYIFICKTNGMPIEKEIVMHQYRNNERTRRYLPSWIAEAGLTDILKEMMLELVRGNHGEP